MKYYRITVTFIILIAFATQVLHGAGVWSYILPIEISQSVGYCANKDFQGISKIDFNTSQNTDISCINNANLLFVSKRFSWEPEEIKLYKEAIISNKTFQEQLYVDELLDPPRV
ncbi:MAG TPA: hypothetical protein VK050_07900 [Flavobacteriaceae bacterium]|nr:hypothetical protein [Flavobacteriaceae bacterium]